MTGSHAVTVGADVPLAWALMAAIARFVAGSAWRAASTGASAARNAATDTMSARTTVPPPAQNMAAASASVTWLAMAQVRVASDAVLMIARWASSRPLHTALLMTRVMT